MSVPQQTIAVGAAITGSGAAVGFIAQAIPILQFASFTVGIIVGILTAVYTYRRIKNDKFD